jgi:hypothetical protein
VRPDSFDRRSVGLFYFATAVASLRFCRGDAMPLANIFNACKAWLFDSFPAALDPRGLARDDGFEYAFLIYP